MFGHDNRAKLINAINFFVRETHHCHTVKLFKLLNFLDFEHYRQTGFSVTGLTYKAWPQGPVPSELWHELRSPSQDLRSSVSIAPVRDDLTDQVLRRDLRAYAQFDASYFSKRELQIMQELAEIFLDAPGDQMSTFSHSRNLPWHQVYRDGAGRGHPIPYDLARTSDPIIGVRENLSEADHEYRKSVFSA